MFYTQGSRRKYILDVTVFENDFIAKVIKHNGKSVRVHPEGDSIFKLVKLIEGISTKLCTGFREANKVLYYVVSPQHS